MYYTESSQLQAELPLDSSVISTLDRLVAHAYAIGGRGRVNEAWLTANCGADASVVQRLMAEYARLGVVRAAPELICDCDARNDPDDAECIVCGRPLSLAHPSPILSYFVLKQPIEPAFDPDHQPVQPDVMISYRRAECDRLAADLYYLLRERGLKVFLDRGDIAPGSNPPSEYLRAASSARNFIVLLSGSYFESGACRAELAHAARAHARILRVNVPPLPAIPADMQWVNAPNWIGEEGSNAGLDPKLEAAILAAIDAGASPIADLRLEGCRYLMETMSLDALQTLWVRAGLSAGRVFPASRPEAIRLIEQELTPGRLDQLCGLLAPG